MLHVWGRCFNAALYCEYKIAFEAVGMFEDLSSWGSQATQKAGIPGGFPSTSYLHGWGEQWRQDCVGNIYLFQSNRAIYAWVCELKIISLTWSDEE